MKLVYLIEDDAFIQSGVIEKISNQIESLSIHANIIPVTFKNKTEKRDCLIQDCFFVTPIFDLKNRYLNKWACNRSLFKLLNEIKPDIIYLRQSIWNPIYLRLFKNYKCILEINSLDLNELKYYGFIKKNIYLIGRNWILKNASGLIAVSNEIKRSLDLFNDKIHVSSNGISNKKFQQNFNIKIEKKNLRPQVLFTGSLFQKWQGVEKVFFLAEHLKSCDFHCVGFDDDSKLLSINLSNLYAYPRLTKKELNKLIKTMDIGIGTLSLYEKEMIEASPLKVREYVENLLPIIIGYQDTDFSNKDFSFVLQLPNHKQNIKKNLEKIEEFIYSNYQKRIEIDLYNYTIEFKENEKMVFILKVLNS